MNARGYDRRRSVISFATTDASESADLAKLRRAVDENRADGGHASCLLDMVDELRADMNAMTARLQGADEVNEELRAKLADMTLALRERDIHQRVRALEKP